MTVEYMQISTHEEDKRIALKSIEGQKAPSAFGAKDALIYAFCLLLQSTTESLHTAQVKAKELNAARSKMSALIKEQASDDYSVVASKGQENNYYEVLNASGTRFLYIGTKPPSTSGAYINCFWGQVPKSKAQVVTIKGKTLYVVQATANQGDGMTMHRLTVRTKPLTPAGFNAAAGENYYLVNGQIFYASQVQAHGIDGNNSHFLTAQKWSGTKQIGLPTLNRYQEQDQTIEKARAFLANKINMTKQNTDMQEAGLVTTTDMEGQVIQQGMKYATLLGQLASEISQL